MFLIFCHVLSCVCYYYPEKAVYERNENEISHILFLRGNPKEKILYCYIELFNVYNFIVIINDNYEGKSVKESYIYDIENKNVIDNTIDLEITRHELLNLPKPGPTNVQELVLKKMKTILKVKGIEFDFFEK